MTLREKALEMVQTVGWQKAMNKARHHANTATKMAEAAAPEKAAAHAHACKAWAEYAKAIAEVEFLEPEEDKP